MAQATQHHTAESDDPCVLTGTEISLLQERFNLLDGRRGIGTDIEKTYLEREIGNLSDRLLALREYLSIIRATTVAGAMVQLNQILIILDTAAEDDGDVRAIRRLLFSIHRAMKASVGPRIPSGREFRRAANSAGDS